MNLPKKLIVVFTTLLLCFSVFAENYPYAKITKSDIETYVKYLEKPDDTALALKYAALNTNKQLVLAAGVNYVFAEPIARKTYTKEMLNTYKAMGIDMIAQLKETYSSLMDPKDVATFDKYADIILKSKVLNDTYLKN